VLVGTQTLAHRWTSGVEGKTFCAYSAQAMYAQP
jgi:hypothetical protein